MSQIDAITQYNHLIVEEGRYAPYEASGRPVKKMTIVTCMDCRLIELLPQALNVRNGDAIMIKCAGGMISDPYGDVIKSILVSLYELGSRAVYIIGHTDCGMHGLTAERMIDDMKARGIDDERLAGLQRDPQKWLGGFASADDQVRRSVGMVTGHPLLPQGTPVYGLIIDPKTGALNRVV